MKSTSSEAPSQRINNERKNRKPTNSSTYGIIAIVLGVALFGALLETLFIPMGPTVPPILVGVLTAASLILLVATVTRKS